MKSRLLAFLALCIVRALSATLRYRIDDQADVGNRSPTGTGLWCFWHNRVLGMPKAIRTPYGHVKGVVLTSASGDGEILARVMKGYGLEAARGSSSRRGTRALLELTKWVENGYHAAITPDGPRGPRYRLAAGVVYLSQRTGVPIIPVHLNYSSYWTLNSWDRFMIPKPFSRVDVTFAPLEYVRTTDTDEAFETERLRIEKILNDGRTDRE